MSEKSEKYLKRVKFLGCQPAAVAVAVAVTWLFCLYLVDIVVNQNAELVICLK